MRMPALCSAVLAALWLGNAHADPALTIRGAWVPEAPPAARVQAAYMDLVNAGTSALVVVGARSADFARVEMHRTVQSQGMARMEAQPELRIEPGVTLSLVPGGLHLMLMEPKRRLVAGDRVDIELRLQDGTPISTAAEVRAPPPAGSAHEHHHH